jgi:hypothetical protein
MKIAEAEGLIRVEKKESGENYFISLSGIEYPASEICRSLDTLGAVGYYRNGTDLGVQLCTTGITSSLQDTIIQLEKIRNEIFSNEIDRIKNSIHRTKYLNWFDVKERFSPMGVKMIGVFCNLIKNMDFIDEDKYLAGFQSIPDEVPGFGSIDFNSTKISMRVSDFLTEKIRSGKKPGLSDFLITATENIGGFADGCHSLSAATTVRLGQEKALIREIENVLDSKNEQ